MVTLTVTDNEGANDDAEERQNGNVTLSSSDLELVDDGSKNQTVGMRFAGIEIPQGSAIVSAHVQFQVDETDSGLVSLQIRGQAADDTLSFSSSNGDISSRPTTTAFVDWAGYKPHAHAGIDIQAIKLTFPR